MGVYIGSRVYKQESPEAVVRFLQAQLDEERRIGDWMVEHEGWFSKKEGIFEWEEWGVQTHVDDFPSGGDWRKAVLGVMDE